MPSTLRTPNTLSLGALALLVVSVPMPGTAQQLSAQATVAISIRVRPTLAIRSVVPTARRIESGNRLTSAAVVHVQSNLPHRLTVRLAVPTSDASVRVLVRNANGEFEPLGAGASVTAVVSRTGAERGHEVVCRLETSAPDQLDAHRCALVYELSAEQDDVLLRATATSG